MWSIISGLMAETHFTGFKRGYTRVKLQFTQVKMTFNPLTSQLIQTGLCCLGSYATRNLPLDLHRPDGYTTFHGGERSPRTEKPWLATNKPAH